MKKYLNLALISAMTISSIHGKVHELSRPFSTEEKNLVTALYDIGVLRFDSEAWKDFFPEPLPYYIDLRHVISYPAIFKQVVLLMSAKAQELSFDTVCGVPYTGLPFASNVASQTNTSLIMRRTQRKNYATAKKIEGTIKPGMHCLLIDDVVFTGSSLLETIHDLEEEQLKVTDCIVLMDREQGGIKFANDHGYTVHTLFTIGDFLHILHDTGKIDSQLFQHLLEWNEQHQVPGVNWKKDKQN